MPKPACGDSFQANPLRVRKKFFLVVVVSTATLVVAMLAAEVYLRHQQAPASAHPYDIELATHDGRKISPLVGPVKLALAPFTVYRNLPSQHTLTININSRGLRAEEGAEQDSHPKIIFLGGSSLSVAVQGASTAPSERPQL